MLMAALKNFFVVALEQLPWLVILVAAAVAFMRRRNAATVVQAIGALMLFLLAFVHWGFTWFIARNVSYSVADGIHTFFWFVMLLALATFAAGYAWEKYQQWSGARGTFPG